MAVNLQKIGNVHRHVMRQLASGISLETICEEEGLNYSSWKQIVASPLFASELSIMQNEVDEKLVEHLGTGQDATFLKLKSVTEKAVNRLEIEVDNAGEDSSAATRIKAATSILDRAGYAPATRRPDDSSPTVVITITAEKAAFATSHKVSQAAAVPAPVNSLPASPIKLILPPPAPA